MTEAGDRPAPALWPAAALEGLRAFAIVTAVGVAASLAVWLLASPAYGLGVALRIGALYLGAFHHVPIRIEGEFDIGQLTGGVLRSSELPTESTSFLEVGVALLAVTLLAGWLLFHAGRRLAAPEGRSVAAGALRGAAVAPAYAGAMVLTAITVKISEPLALGRLVEGELRVSVDPLRSLLFALVIAGVSGGLGGLWASLASRQEEPAARTAAASLVGGWRALWVGLALSYAGLFVAGVVQPEDPVALLTPSTARYYETVFGRPAAGAAILGHHIALAPNEATWTLVPALGGCDVVRGSESADILCYDRFPALRELGSVEFGPAPTAYLLFLLAPAVATLLGGREAARRSGAPGRPGAAVGALAGVAFGLMLGVTALLSGVSLTYGATVGEQGGGGSLWIGPQVVIATLLGIAWGVAGGAIGGATAGFRSAAARRPGAPAPRL